MGKVYCTVCKKRCKGDVFKIEQIFVHPKCFRCTKCHSSLQQGGFFMRDQRFYCTDDYQAEFGVKCASCHDYVEGELVTVLDKTFHTHCFRCTTCKHLFSSGERTTILDDAYYCLACASHLSTANTPLVSPVGDVLKSGASPSKSHRTVSTLPSTRPTWSDTSPMPMGRMNRTTSGDGSNGLVPKGSEAPNPYVGGQLTVQINENGFADSDTDKHKLETIGPITNDTLLSHTPGQTFSAGSFTYSSTERRTLPPGVDYGYHYPMSYLQMQDEGRTALMSSEAVPLQPNAPSSLRARSLMRPDGYLSNKYHPSHLDGPRASSSPRVGVVARNGVGGAGSSTEQIIATTSFGRHINGYFRSRTLDLPNANRTPNVARPRRDLYVRRRELSPGSASVGSGLIGYHSHNVPTKDHMPSTRMNEPSYSRSTPSVRAKRGMTLLAESLVQPRVRSDRSLSPDSAAAESWAEAKKLASYPNAQIPDSSSLPAIERFDFPAPPSPAVVMIEKRREKRLSQKSPETTIMNGGTLGLRNGTMTGTESDMSDMSPKSTAKKHQRDVEIETLRRLGKSSGITAALLQELEATRQMRIQDLDPVSASRSPSANVEPGYKTRYDRHAGASPSRDTRHDRRGLHTLSYRMDYTNTGGRSGTMSNLPLRPGYTSGMLHSPRAVSLPRPPITNLNGESASPSGTNTHYPASTATGARPGLGHRMDHTLTTDESLHTTLGGFDSRYVGLEGIGSAATSALSVDGFTASSGEDVTTLAPSSSAYVLKSGTMTGLSHTVTGLRPVSLMMKKHSLGSRHRFRGYGTESEVVDVNSIPTVQSFLRPSSPDKPSHKTYPYEQLKVSQKQLPKLIDRTHLEKHLSAEEFESLFGMSFSAYNRLPEWKRNDLKNKLDLM